MEEEKAVSDERLLVMAPPHPLIKHWISVLRDKQTPCVIFGTWLQESYKHGIGMHREIGEIGYGDIHAVSVKEMTFVIGFIFLNMYLGACLVGDFYALSPRETETIKQHMCLKYERDQTEASVLEDIPVSIRAKIAQTLYKPYIKEVPLFAKCTSAFIHQIGYTWIGSLKLSDDSYVQFKNIGLAKRYSISLYFAIVAMATVEAKD